MKRKFNFGDIVKLKTGNAQVYGYIREGKTPYIEYKCLECGSYDKKASSNFRKTGCRVCNNQRVAKGVNDMWTTAPEISELLANKDDGYLYTKFSTKKVDWVCPSCNSVISNISIAQVSYAGALSCPFCSNGISFPNRIMAKILFALNIDYVREWSPKWANKLRYDFYIPSEKIVLEMDGGYGHGHKGTCEQRAKELEADKKKDTLANSNGLKIIRIDCNYPTQKDRNKYIIDNILSSELAGIFDLTKLDLKSVIKSSCEKTAVNAAKMYEHGKCINEIAKELNVHPVTISRYLSRCNELGICNYSSSKRRNIDYSFSKHRVVAIDNFNISTIYPSINDAAKCTGVSRSSISRCLNGKQNRCKGYTYKYLNNKMIV